MKRSFSILIVLALSACSHAPLPSAAEDDMAISKLALPEANGLLEQTKSQLESMEEKLRAVEARRNSLQRQAATDVNKQSAVDGAEAELASLQSKRGILLHRQHVIEGRLRELGAGDGN